MAILLPAWLWMVMSYRPGATSPETLQLANDFNWMMFIGMFPPAVLQNVSIALCIFSDKSSRPVYPRWLAVAPGGDVFVEPAQRLLGSRSLMSG